MAKYYVEFKHLTEITYRGSVEANSEEEARKIVQDTPFDIDNLSEGDEQGLEVIDIEISKSGEDL